MTDLEANPEMKEKSEVHSAVPVELNISGDAAQKPSWSMQLYLKLQKLDRYGVEARGIERVRSGERKPGTWSTWVGLCLIWSSAGLGLSTFAAGMLGPLYYNLTFAQSVGCIFGGGLLGSVVSGYSAVFGKRHGLRALANSRYSFGYFGNMAMAILNILTEGIFGIQMGILGGQALNVLSRGKLPVAGAIPIVLLAGWVIATGGWKFIHHWSRIAFIFPLIVIISMFAVSGHLFSNETIEKLDGKTQSGLTLSFLAVVFGSSAGWIPVSADYYIYLTESTPDSHPFLMSCLGIWLLPCVSYTCGAGYGSILMTNKSWSDYYESHGESAAAIILYSLERLGNVRYFFIFIMAISTLNNNIFNLYSISISMQLLGPWTEYVPRLVWNLVGAIVIFVIAIAGRSSIYSIMSNTAALIGYWTIVFFAIIWIEQTVFRKRRGYDLDGWDDPKRLPKGYAAGLAFCIGAAGSIVGMGQTWYYGPIARHIGSEGGDIGIELGFAFALISYPLLRSIELKKFGL